jgi:outer membrane protein assembly factor BamE (lipoprotein component of BamABCDE complex)
MNKLLKSTLILIPLTFGLSGCVISIDADDFEDYNKSDWQDREYENRKNIARLTVGMSYQAVLDKLGTADFTEVHKTNGDRYQVLFYRTHRKHGDGVTTKDECTPVIFKNDQLDGWGTKAYKLL